MNQAAKPMSMIVFWVVEARDKGHLFSGSGWSRQLAGSSTDHATKADAERELVETLAEGSFESEDLRVSKRVRHG